MFGNAVVFAQMPLSLLPKVLDTIEVGMLIRKELAMVNTIMLKLRHIDDWF